MHVFLEELHQTIVAEITPKGIGGVSVIRISGTNARDAGSVVCDASIHNVNTHAVVVRNIVDENNVVVDKVMVLCMNAPATFTGENVVEISTHGNPLIVKEVIRLLIDTKLCRIARPGEFSFRSFINGKISLMQAEAINDSILARDIHSMRSSMMVLSGKYNERLFGLYNSLIDIVAILEAHVDFPEDVTGIDHNNVNKQLDVLIVQASEIMQVFQLRSHKPKNKIMIMGAPNVGKSSIVNALLGEDRSIVSDTPGTTRDVVRSMITVLSDDCEICDTAGIRPTDDPVERAGIEKAFGVLRESYVVFIVLDIVQDDADSLEVVRKIVAACQDKETMIYFILNKTDLVSYDNLIIYKTKIIKEFKGIDVICCSVKTQQGLHDVVHKIEQSISRPVNNTEQYNNNLRHYNEVAIMSKYLEQAKEMYMCAEINEELVLLCLRDALLCIKRLLGVEIDEVVLDSIFSKFCIGK